MANAYYTTQTVKSYQDAKKFTNEYTWKILEILREAGSRGLTEIDIRKKVNKKMHTTVAQSRIYDILDELYKDEWVHRRYSREDGARRFSLAFNWASVGLNEDYDKKIVVKEGEYMKRKLFPAYIDLIKTTINDLAEENSKWLPDPKNNCGYCAEEGKETNHEAVEFVSSLLI